MAAGAAAPAFALLVDGALLIRRQQLWRTETTHLETAIWFPREAAIPSGCLDNGLAYGPALTDARCFALLYTASTCSFCSAQLPEWRSLVRISRTLGCDALRVVPRRSGEASPYTDEKDGRQLIFLDQGWLSGSPPTRTPTLIVFAREATVAWCRVGQLDAAATQSAAKALSAAAAADANTPEARKSGERLQCR